MDTLTWPASSATISSIRSWVAIQMEPASMMMDRTIRVNFLGRSSSIRLL